jgi:hypothetical protein
MADNFVNPFAETQRKEMIKEKFIPKRYLCTVVSLLPFEPPPENKPHLIPSTFRIPKADEQLGLRCTHVGEACYFVPNPFDDRNTRVTVSPAEVARSLVEDYVSGQMCLDENSAPGLFWLEGELTELDVLEHYGAEVEKYKLFQRGWFKRLVDLADADFTKNKNRLAISDVQKAAAVYLHYKAEWVDFIGTTLQDTKLCQFCGTTLLATAIKCLTCNEVVDAVAYKKLKAEMETVNG